MFIVNNKLGISHSLTCWQAHDYKWLEFLRIIICNYFTQVVRGLDPLGLPLENDLFATTSVIDYGAESKFDTHKELIVLKGRCQ